MRKLTCLIAGVLIAFSGFAQSGKGYLFLKNGTILKGKYEYFSNLKKYRIESAGNIWIFKSEEVDSVKPLREKTTHELFDISKDKRLYNHTEIGLLAGNQDNSQSAPLIINSQIKYNVCPKVSLGVGAGIEFFKESYVPLFLSAEYRFRNSASTPYIFVNGGYLIGIEDSRMMYYDYPVYSSSIVWPGYNSNQKLDPKGGILINPGIGYLYYFNQNVGFSVSLGYRYHRLNYTGDKDYGLDIDYNRLSVKLGILFK